MNYETIIQLALNGLYCINLAVDDHVDDVNAIYHDVAVNIPNDVHRTIVVAVVPLSHASTSHVGDKYIDLGIGIGRSLDVDDLICNFIGIAAGFFIGLAIRNIKGKNKTTEEQPTVSSSSKTAEKQREKTQMKKWIKVLIIVHFLISLNFFVYLCSCVSMDTWISDNKISSKTRICMTVFLTT